MILVRNIEEILENMQTLDESLISNNMQIQEKAKKLIKGGRCFIACKSDGIYRFYPSRFVGYFNNTIEKHETNETKDGRETNPEISRILKEKLEADSILEQEYQRFCKSLGIIPDNKAHTFWRIDKEFQTAKKNRLGKDVKVGGKEWFVAKAKNKDRGEYVNHIEQLREKFLERFSPQNLEHMDGAELLERVFDNKHDTMMYLLMYDSQYRNFGASSEYPYMSIIYKGSDGCWTYFYKNDHIKLSQIEAETKAEEVRDKLLACVKTIDEVKPNTISDYTILESKLREISFLNNYVTFLKYYQMVFPYYFPGMYADSILNRCIQILGLRSGGTSTRKRISNMGIISIFIRNCDINNIIFGSIYADEWGWTKTAETCPAAQENENILSAPDNINMSYYSLGFNKFDAVGIAAEIDDDIENSNLEGKEREVIAKIRANQTEYRSNLLKRYDKCHLCGVNDKTLLIASHIKPWSVCNPHEKLDDHNGLLLCPNHDKLFDAGFISFTDNGGIMISPKLDKTNQMFMNIQETMKIRMTEKNKEYMKYHRENVFQGDE